MRVQQTHIKHEVFSSNVNLNKRDSRNKCWFMALVNLLLFIGMFKQFCLLQQLLT